MKGKTLKSSSRIRPPGVDLEKGKIVFDFIKSQDFRVVYVDGAQGGPSPRGFIQVALYNERWPIPKQMTHALVDGQVKDEDLAKRKSREAVVRQVEVELIMTPQTAKVIGEWLTQHADTVLGKKASPQSNPATS